MDDIIYASAKTLAAAIRAKDVSALEVVEAHLRRIDEVNPKLNAVVQLAGDRAVSEAREADDILARGDVKGPLHGVPITLKDSHDTAGIISTGGTQGRASFVPEKDSTVAARMRAAGAILLGKTNTPELTLSFETDNLVYGVTNNPYDLSRTPGGSSGGAAAIIASGGSPLDLGSDTAGSIRVPSHFCGIAGIKPTTGRVPRTGHIIPYNVGALDPTTQIGPMARFVEDLVLTLPIIAGVDWVDPAIVPMPLGNPNDVDLHGLRVAYYVDDGVMASTVETVSAVHDAVAALVEAGVSATEDRPEALGHAAEVGAIRADGGAWVKRLLAKAGTREYHRFLKGFVEDAEPLPTGEYTALLERQDAYRSAMLAFMERYDAIVCPVRPFPALPHGASRDDAHRGSNTYTSAYNMTGWPGTVVRAGTSPDGLPIGVQAIARPWREDVSLALAMRIEEALGGWQRPSL
jgi:amidase